MRISDWSSDVCSSDLLLKLLLKIRARELNVAARLIARTDDLEALAAGRRDDIPLMQGWRFEVFGRAAPALVEGRMGFAVKNGKPGMSGMERAEEGRKSVGEGESVSVSVEAGGGG